MLNTLNSTPFSPSVIMPRMKMNIAALSLEITKATHSEIQLFPAGEFSAVDGRPHTDEVESGKWVLTAELAAQLVAQVAARTTPFVIDYEHQTLRAVNNGKPAPAAGWFSQVEWREGVGLYATGVEWTENAAAMIAAGEYKFISPVFAYNKRGEVLELLHAALTNTPALDGMDAVMLAAASRLASLSTETETTTVDEELLNDLLSSLRWMLNSTGSDGDVTVLVRCGKDFLMVNSTSDPVTQSQVGKLCYVEDSVTVAKTDNSSARPVAGKVIGICGDGVWVHFS